jgi:hypothetical protein
VSVIQGMTNADKYNCSGKEVLIYTAFLTFENLALVQQ